MSSALVCFGSDLSTLLWQRHLAGIYDGKLPSASLCCDLISPQLLAGRGPDSCYPLTIKTIVGLALLEISIILESSQY